LTAKQIWGTIWAVIMAYAIIMIVKMIRLWYEERRKLKDDNV
jgi:hypothetical protein